WGHGSRTFPFLRVSFGSSHPRGYKGGSGDKEKHHEDRRGAEIELEAALRQKCHPGGKSRVGNPPLRGKLPPKFPSVPTQRRHEPHPRGQTGQSALGAESKIIIV